MLVRIEYELLPPVLDIDQALSGGEVIWGQDNVFKRYLLTKGDVDKAFAKADFVVQGEYSTGAQEQLYIENNAMIAVLRDIRPAGEA